MTFLGCIGTILSRNTLTMVDLLIFGTEPHDHNMAKYTRHLRSHWKSQTKCELQGPMQQQSLNL